MLGPVKKVGIRVLRSGPRRDDAVEQGLHVPLHAGVLHELHVGGQHENSLVADRAGIGFRIVQRPFEFDMTHIGTLEGHRQFRLVAHRMADRSELRPAVEIDRLDDERVALPMAARIAEPRRRPILAMRHAFGVHGLKHRALLEQKPDVFVVLKICIGCGVKDRIHPNGMQLPA